MRIYVQLKDGRLLDSNGNEPFPDADDYLGCHEARRCDHKRNKPPKHKKSLREED